MEQGLEDWHSGGLCCRRARVVDLVAADRAAYAIRDGVIIGALLLRLRVVVGGVAAALGRLFSAMDGSDRAGVHEATYFLVLGLVPVCFVRSCNGCAVGERLAGGVEVQRGGRFVCGGSGSSCQAGVAAG